MKWICVVCCRLSQPVAAWQQGCGKWRENEEMERVWKWRESVEMEREWGNGERVRKWREREISSLSISSASLSPFPIFPSHFLSFRETLTHALWGNNSGSKQAARKPHNLCRPGFCMLCVDVIILIVFGISFMIIEMMVQTTVITIAMIMFVKYVLIRLASMYIDADIGQEGSISLKLIKSEV